MNEISGPKPTLKFLYLAPAVANHTESIDQQRDIQEKIPSNRIVQATINFYVGFRATQLNIKELLLMVD